MAAEQTYEEIKKLSAKALKDVVDKLDGPFDGLKDFSDIPQFFVFQIMVDSLSEMLGDLSDDQKVIFYKLRAEYYAGTLMG